MLIDIHSHTSRYSRCSRIGPADLVRRAIAKDLQGIIITEHHYLWSDKELRELVKEAGGHQNILVLSAQEIETDLGHVVVFGAPETIAKPTTVDEIRARYPHTALVWAHPWRDGVKPVDERLRQNGFDAVEIFSTNHTLLENYLALEAWHRYKFTATAGSDAHSAERVGTMPTLFDHPVETIDDVVVEICHGRCRPYYRESTRSGKSSAVKKITIGPKGTDEHRYRLIVRAAADDSSWKKLSDDADVMARIAMRGFDKGQFRVPAVLSRNSHNRLVVEEGQRGKPLHELLTSVELPTARRYLEMTAAWLGRLHSADVGVRSREDTIRRENERLDAYRQKLDVLDSSRRSAFLESIDFVREKEMEMLAGDGVRLVLCHGDYQPRNVLIGQDAAYDPSTRFVCAIDFDTAMEFIPAFDIGYFLAQFAFQMRNQPILRKTLGDDVFLKAYQAQTGTELPLPDLVAFFKVRAALSIADFLVSFGMLDSQELNEILGMLKIWRAQSAGVAGDAAGLSKSENET